MSERIGAQSLPLSELGRRFHECDVVSPDRVGRRKRELKVRKRRPMLMLDLAMPHDIELEVARLDDGYLYTVDSLARYIQTSGERRRAAVLQAERMVSTGV